MAYDKFKLSTLDNNVSIQLIVVTKHPDSNNKANNVFCDASVSPQSNF